MKKLLLILGVVGIVLPLILVMVVPVAAADWGDRGMKRPLHPLVLNNGSFEEGLSGWQTVVPRGGYVKVVSEWAEYQPTHGNYFALLKTDGPGSFTTLSQSFRARRGAILTGQAFFATPDYLPYNDRSQVVIKKGDQVVATVFSASVADVGDFGSTGWVVWQYTFQEKGIYTLDARITNDGDASVDSHMGLDGISFKFK